MFAYMIEMKYGAICVAVLIRNMIARCLLAIDMATKATALRPWGAGGRRACTPPPTLSTS